MNKRDYGIERLRIVACLMVVAIHTTMYGWYNVSPRTYNWIVLNAYEMMVRCGVPLFFMISGAVFLSKEEIDIRRLWTKNIRHIVLSFIPWLVIYSVMDLGIHKAAENPQAVFEALMTPKYHLWYLEYLFGIYVLVPVLHKLAHALDEKTARYFVLVFFIFGICVKTIDEMAFRPKLIHDLFQLYVKLDLVGYVGYFLLGYILKRYLEEHEPNVKKYLAGYVITTILGTIENQLLANAQDWPTQSLYGNFSLPVFLQAVFLFLYFVGRKWNDTPEKIRWVRRISDATFTVYLAHPLIIERLRIHLRWRTEEHNVLFSVPLTVVAVFVFLTVVGILWKGLTQRIQSHGEKA